MKLRGSCSVALVIASAWIGQFVAVTALHAQQAQTQPQTANPSAAADSTTPVFKAETRLVLVDTVVTDGKHNYVTDLTARDFKIWEDNKEQVIKSFSTESGSSDSSGHRHYLVLFFDNSTLAGADQIRAREAAAKFVEANAGPDRYMAVVNFGGTMTVAANFTADAERLKQVVLNVKFSSVSPNEPAPQQPVQIASLGAPQLGHAQASFGARSLLLALRDVAKSLASVPGRKSLVMFTTGFSITPSDPDSFQRQSELTAAISACNKANVAIYPIDVRGLSTGISAGGGGSAYLEAAPDFGDARLVTATLDYSADDQPAYLLYVQKGGSGGGGGHGGSTGGTGTGGTGGTHGTGTGTGTVGGGRRTGAIPPPGSFPGNPSVYPLGYNPYSQSTALIPQTPSSLPNQQVLYQLAQGTGGFVITNSNDLLTGLQRIAKEQTQYYILGYTPTAADEGSCHVLKVKVDRGGTNVRYRSGYCNSKPTDVLAGKPEEKELQSRMTGSQPGTIAASMLAPYFYTSVNEARVNLAIEIPPNSIKFEKVKGKQHATVNVAGIAYKLDGSVAAKFSDSLNLDFQDKKEVEQFNSKPFHYETQFDVAAGHYNLKVAFNTQGSDTFGKLEAPLVIDPYDGKQFAISGVALSKDIHPVNQMGQTLDALILEDRTPLVTQGLQLVPTGSDQFKKADRAAFYVELYSPAMVEPNPPKISLKVAIVDRKTGEKKIEAGGEAADAKAGSPLVPVGLILPVAKLDPGSYRLELEGVDSAGHVTPERSADFEVH